MSAPTENTRVDAAGGALPLDVTVIDHWLVFDCPRCQQTIKLDRKDSVHNIECPSCQSGFAPLLDREVKLPPRKVPARKRRRRRGPRGNDSATPPKREPTTGGRPTASSLPSQGVVKLSLTPMEPAEEEPKAPVASRLPVRSALELERRRVESLESQPPVKPDERELDAVIEEQSGGKYKRIRVRTRKKRKTERQRTMSLYLMAGMGAALIMGLGLWGAWLVFKGRLGGGDKPGSSTIDAHAANEPIGSVIKDRDHLISQFIRAKTVDQLLVLIRYPKRLKPAIRAFYGGDELPELRLKPINRLEGVRAILPRNFSRFPVMIGSHSLPIYVENTESHGYRFDWESFVGLGSMPWSDFVEGRSAKTARMRVYISEADYYEAPFDERNHHCLRIKDASRKYTLYGYYERNVGAYSQLTGKIFEASSQANISNMNLRELELSVILDIRYPAGASNPVQVEIVNYVKDTWLVH